jgi:ABC-type ATPase involved in cell division
MYVGKSEMPSIDVVVAGHPSNTVRARQLQGMFDVPVSEKQTLEWHGDLPIDDRKWNIGLIVGPSGCGKTTIARNVFGEFAPTLEWRGDSVIDDFPSNVSVQDISAICQAVGFNTIPAWLRPFSVLSNGEKFRVELARRLIEGADPIIVDEFTSVVDRQVAQIGSYAVQKAIRRRNKKFIAVSCHSDIIEWLNPDWILEPATMKFSWRCLCRRPDIDVEIYKVPHAAWQIFAPFHYMSADLHGAAQCYCLHVGDTPAAFSALLYRPHPKARNIWGLSRAVTLPDFQGLGLIFVLMDTLAAALKGCGQRTHSYPAHPAFIRSFDASPKWALEKKPGMSTILSQSTTLPSRIGGRPNAVFSYAGEAMEHDEAAALLSISSLH